MLEVVFSDSVKGGMKHIRKDVVYIGFSLDIGNISVGIDDPIRRELFRKIWGRFRLSNIEENDFFDAQRYDMDRLLDAASKGTPIRIWKSDAPYSTCGFFYVCDILRNIECELFVVSLPNSRGNSGNIVKEYSEWRDVDAEELDEFLVYEKQVTVAEKKNCSNYWKNLIQENSELRAQINGKLVSVPVCYYDFLITKSIPDNEFIMARLIGELLIKYPIGVHDTWYAYRIENMIRLGNLEVVEDGNDSHPYGKVLRILRK